MESFSKELTTIDMPFMMEINNNFVKKVSFTFKKIKPIFFPSLREQLEIAQ